MRRTAILFVMGALMAGCPEDGDDPAAADTIDTSEGTDGSDGTDATEGIDATDGTEGTDATDGTGATDGTDGTDGTDATDETDPPGPTCEAYCAAVTTACTGQHAQYESAEACESYCAEEAALPLGNAADTMQNSVGCRAHYAALAADDTGDGALQAEHCPAAGPTGADVCGSWCHNYCLLTQRNCTDDDALYASDEACGTTCETFATAGAPGDTTGDTVQCRIHYAAEAFSDPGEHCLEAAPDGGEACVDPPAEPTCQAYCEAVQTACGDSGEPTSQYASLQACLDYCALQAQLPAGTAGDTSGNTIGCRLNEATLAAAGPTDAILHCPSAGPTGGDTCGTWCDNYCHLAGVNCSGGNALDFGAAGCMTACAALDTAGAPGDSSGDSVQCRLHYLGLAGTDGATSAAEHCPAAAPDGGGVCVDTEVPTCAEYCATITANCVGVDAQYDDEADCLSYCSVVGGFPLGTSGATSGNGIGCRTTYAELAATTDTAASCDIAGRSGGGVCGSWCVNYCHLAMLNCTEDEALYASQDECLTACESLPAGGAPGDTTGDSVQCRIYHLGEAGIDAAAAALHCPYGAPDGGGVCGEPLPPPTCQQYCEQVSIACMEENAQFAGAAACITWCQDEAQTPGGNLGDTSGNSVGCRAHYAALAAAGEDEAALHCPAAGPSGGNVCGTWCDNYCHLALLNCTGADALFADAGECQTACTALPVGDDPLATTGDSVQCRIHHLGVAGQEDSATEHCAYGAPDAAAVCMEP